MNARRSRHAPLAKPDTATGRVYEGIYDAVLERRLAPGDRLREEELALGFGVSRTVVRQALQRLAQDRVIELQHNHGARVPEPGLDEAVHVFEARRVVECEIARRLGGRLDQAQLAELHALADAEAAADGRGDRAQAVRLSGEFHRALARMHGNPVFLRLLDGLLPTTSMLMALSQAGGGRVCVAHRHVELIAAMAGSPAGAAAEMRRHLVELERSLTRTLRPARGPAPRQTPGQTPSPRFGRAPRPSRD
ncbi:GntR family transcriptional regulator [Aquabacterium sp.]|uniref:GntR family transcriptional regulator n=1 Tax=Aquabacterium sp. TaxID=1872578 RepID=UPI002BD25F97|nr:GntR family transcriptional regulator [Aquabacterium sp.]HSW07643.1 GntR family transcriptional regulator [Aquabacterium sp.]